MTIRMLKELIKDLPDDYRIYEDNGYDDETEIMYFVDISPSYPGRIVFMAKHSMEVGDELSAMADLAFEENWSDEEFYREALERGFTWKDFPDPNLVRRRMENYGLI